METEEDSHRCVLCEHADDAGSAMAYLKQMDTALGGRTESSKLGKMMLESYNTFFYEPAIKAGQEVPALTEKQITKHFEEHDINPLRQMQADIINLNKIQRSLLPANDAALSESEAKTWAHYQRLKMDLVKQYEMCKRHTPTDMPSLGM